MPDADVEALADTEGVADGVGDGDGSTTSIKLPSLHWYMVDTDFVSVTVVARRLRAKYGDAAATTASPSTRAVSGTEGAWGRNTSVVFPCSRTRHGAVPRGAREDRFVRGTVTGRFSHRYVCTGTRVGAACPT